MIYKVRMSNTSAPSLITFSHYLEVAFLVWRLEAVVWVVGGVGWLLINKISASNSETEFRHCGQPGTGDRAARARGEITPRYVSPAKPRPGRHCTHDA